MMSPECRSWKSERPMPHSKPAWTSRASSLKRRSEVMAPFQITVPSRRKRTEHGRLDVLEQLVDDLVVADFDVGTLRQFTGALVRPDVEPDDGGARRGRQLPVVLG